MQRFLACWLELLSSTTRSVVKTPTAPPQKEATIGSTAASWDGSRILFMKSAYEVPAVLRPQGLCNSGLACMRYPQIHQVWSCTSHYSHKSDLGFMILSVPGGLTVRWIALETVKSVMATTEGSHNSGHGKSPSNSYCQPWHSLSKT